MHPTPIAIIGVGKIALDQHLPVIAKNRNFRLAGLVSGSGQQHAGVPSFKTSAELFAAVPEVAAVAICTPPGVRHALAREALSAGKHVLLEKPPTPTLGELDDLIAFAALHRRVRFCTWHPGQEWIWQPAGFGVFDPGINALSILTLIAPGPVFVTSAELVYPANRDSPIAVSLKLASPAAGAGSALTADFDWRQTGEQSWNIFVETSADQKLTLTHGGSKLLVDGQLRTEAPLTEYEGIYDRFAQLLASGQSDVDTGPLKIVADAFMVGRRVMTAAFDW